MTARAAKVSWLSAGLSGLSGLRGFSKTEKRGEFPLKTVKSTEKEVDSDRVV